jgi:hypothetical protein
VLKTASTAGFENLALVAFAALLLPALFFSSRFVALVIPACPCLLLPMQLRGPD